MLEHVHVKSKFERNSGSVRIALMTDRSIISRNLESVRERIARAAAKSGRKPEMIRLVAVTKTVGIQEAQALFELGAQDLGENRMQEALRKQEALAPLGIRWHMIGHLQTNKAKKAARNFHLIHSVDSRRLAAALSQAAERADTTTSVLVQVNASGEDTKGGFSPDGLDQALEQITALKHLAVRGLMTMAPFVADPEQTRPVFKALRVLRDRCRKEIPGLQYLSMGMTQDFEVAIEEGADIVRIGTALFREE